MSFVNNGILFGLMIVFGWAHSSVLPESLSNFMENDLPSTSMEDNWDPLSQLTDAAVKTMMSIKPSEEARKRLDAWMAQGEAAQGNPEETGDYYEGDMVLFSPKLIRNGLRAEVTRWPKGRIPYVITGQFTRDEHNRIHKAMAEYGNRTCIRWVDVHKEISPDYVVITSEKTGCWSNVGRIGGEQQLNLERPGCLRSAGTIIHEMMHTLGFVHEQNRYERDDWIDIRWANIQTGKESNFMKMTKNDLNPFGVKYDYGSIMHYSSNAFSKNGNPTIVPKKNSRVTIGQRNGFSDSDIRKIKAMYCQ